MELCLEIIGISVGLCGLMMTVYQLWKSNRIKQAELLESFYREIFSNVELEKFYYKLCYKEVESIIEGSDEERYLNTILGVFDKIEYFLTENKLLGNCELEYIACEIKDVYAATQKPAIQNYLKTQVWGYYQTLGYSEDILPFKGIEKLNKRI